MSFILVWERLLDRVKLKKASQNGSISLDRDLDLIHVVKGLVAYFGKLLDLEIKLMVLFFVPAEEGLEVLMDHL